jgi:hypothetical protein
MPDPYFKRYGYVYVHGCFQRVSLAEKAQAPPFFPKQNEGGAYTVTDTYTRCLFVCVWKKATLESDRTCA